MSEEPVKKILKDFGLSEKEADVYIFLAKHGALRSGEVAKLTKIDKGEVFRLLTNLQTKGLVEKTLESPTRFTSTPFERAIDSFIKYKRDEANRVEKTKIELIKDWNHLTKTTEHPSLEKFVVIEGKRKIYPRIAQMIKEAKKEFSSVSTIAGYLRAEQFGIFDEILNHPLKEKIEFKFISEISNQNIDSMQKLLDKIPKGSSNIRARNPGFGFKLSPRMAIRDNEEIFLFINPQTQEPLSEKDDVGLWTNCRTIVQSFATMFEDLWQNSTDLKENTRNNAKLSIEIEPIADIELANEKYCNALQRANKEIIILTSSQGLIECSKNLALKECSQRDVQIQILAPIIRDNFEAAETLQRFCQIRHIPTNYSEATVIDEKEFFQFKGSRQNDPKSALYSDSPVYVNKIKTNLDNTWKISVPLSDKTLESILGPYSARPSDFLMSKRKIDKIQIIEIKEKTTEKEIVEKMLHAKRMPVKDILKDLHIMYSSGASAIVHPPESFNLPDLMFEIQHIDKNSGLGQADAITVFMWLDTPNGKMFVPVGGVGDNPKGVAFRRQHYAGFPAEINHRLVKKNELEIRVHGNTLFAGWTVPMPLLPPKYVLPPACITIEGYGSVKTNSYSVILPSGFRNRLESNGFDAFVTFMHPASKYSGPGTDGFFIRDLVYTMIPPLKRKVCS